MTIRRKRRQRGKRKALRREALKTWARLTQTAQPPQEYDPLAGIGVIFPVIRNVMPRLIAEELVGVQPLAAPTGMFHDMSGGIEPTFTMRHRYGNRTQKEISEQRKKERKAKKRAGRDGTGEGADLAETEWDKFKLKMDGVA